MGRYVVSLDSREARKEQLAGGKGANLARLCREGFPVPPGYVITPVALRALLSQPSIALVAQKTDWSADELQQIRAFLHDWPLPDGLSRRVARAYETLGGSVAVRSSMVGEDSPLASFAGQLDTILNVQGDEALLEAVKRCWASAFDPRVFAYLKERADASSVAPVLASLSVAVVVQRMVDAQAAGVAFSADPITGQRCVVIEAVRGLGDALVSGRATPDRYIVDARGTLAEVKPALTDRPVLSQELALQLADLVRRVARGARAPQDIEWAWDGSAFWVLQSRPITSLVGRHVYSNRISSEMLPGLVKPLLYSTNSVSMARNVFGRVFTELIGPNDIDFAHTGKRIHSRIYTDLTLFGELFERLGLPANFMEVMMRDERGERRRPPMSPRMLRAGFRILRFAVRHGRVAGEIDAFIHRHDGELEPFRRADWSALTPEQLLVEFQRLQELHSETQWNVFMAPVNMMIRNRHMNNLVRRHAPGVVPSDLLRGLVGLKALEPNAELAGIAAQARGLGDEMVQLLVAGDDGAIRRSLARSDEGRVLAARVDAFLGQFGFLGANGIDFTNPPWAEMPSLIWSAIGRSAQAPSVPAVADVAAIRERAREAVRSRLSWPLRVHFDRLLKTTCFYVDLRERASLLMSEDAYQMRRIFLALGNQLVAHGLLNQRDDVFFLFYDELRQLVEGTMAGDQARALASARIVEMEQDAQIELPDTICGDVVPMGPILPCDDQEYLVGICGSSGLARGFARIILDPADAPGTLTREDILVVPFTDVGWTPLFSGIGGIVAETGGQLSHSAIIAREYGLPAVVSVKKATRLIRDGQPLTVDGSNGRVYLRQNTNL